MFNRNRKRPRQSSLMRAEQEGGGYTFGRRSQRQNNIYVQQGTSTNRRLAKQRTLKTKLLVWIRIRIWGVIGWMCVCKVGTGKMEH